MSLLSQFRIKPAGRLIHSFFSLSILSEAFFSPPKAANKEA
ncbi:MAG: hypothetical protein ACI8XC_001192, partial [Gammaproteobacteria bacterium]